MRKRAFFQTMGLLLLLIGVTACSFQYEKVDTKRDIPGEAIQEIQLYIGDVDLIIQESDDDQISARLSGEKAKGDLWTLETSVDGDVLKVESKYEQKVYLNLRDNPTRNLVLHLPKKQYKSIHLNKTSGGKTLVSVPAKNGEIKKWNIAKMKDQKEIETSFGNVTIHK